MLVDSYRLGVRFRLEGHCLGLDIGGNVGEVDVAATCRKGELSAVLDHRELVVVDGHG